MATIANINDRPGAFDKGKEPATLQNYGVLTPGSTPAPEDRRIEADKARQQAGQSQATPVQPPEVVIAQSKPPSDDELESGAESEGEDSSPPTQEQIDAVQQVLASGQKQYRKILGVNDAYTDPKTEKEAILNAFRKLGMLTHPDYNKVKNSEDAFKRVLAAGKALHIEKDDINEIKFWDGEEDDIVPVQLTEGGKWEPVNGPMDGVDTSLKPDNFHEQIYATATQYLAKLEADPKDADAIEKLKGLNDQIKEHNKSLGVSEERWHDCAIVYTAFASTFEMAAPYRARLKKSHADTEAKNKFDELNGGLKQFNKDHHYPENWIMVLPAEEPAEVLTQQMPNGKAPETKQIVTLNGRNFRRSTRKSGYVTENDVSKKIEGHIPVGCGHQLLLREEGNNGLDIYELVAASTFGKGYGKTYTTQPDAKRVVFGTRDDLKGKSLDTILIAGVASVRRDPNNEPVGGWAREARTIVLASPDENSEVKWYHRSLLGQEFGQAAVDEELNAYRDDAGQEGPIPPTRKAKRAAKGAAEEAAKAA